jgi:predicted ATPase
MSRLLEIRVRGLRTLADVSLPLGGMTVLVGDNGTGKSTLLEALRIVSLIPSGKLIDELHRSHAITTAVRRDCPGVGIDVLIDVDDVEHVYSLTLTSDLRGVATESLMRVPQQVTLFERVGEKVTKSEVFKTDGLQNLSKPLVLLDHLAENSNYFGHVFAQIGAALSGIDSHLPFDVTAMWGKRTRGTAEKSQMREPRMAEPGERLAMFGDNLVNVYQTLKNDRSRAHWQDTLNLVRLGLGSDIEDITVSAAGGGFTTLSVEFGSVGKIPALQLADGILTYLAFVALVRLDDGRSLLAFDEPETHLHPALLARVVTLFESAASRYPVVLSTHSDRLLDALPDPVASVVVTELDTQHRTKLRRLDPEQFEKWRDHYLGVGDIRAESQLESILAESAE